MITLNLIGNKCGMIVSSVLTAIIGFCNPPTDGENTKITLTEQKVADQTSSLSLRSVDEKRAEELVAKARAMYWYIDSAGEHTDWKTFTVPNHDAEYVYFSSDIDTEDEFLTYMSTVYTPEMAHAYLSDLMHDKKIIEHNGRLAHVFGGKGSLMDWDHAKAELLSSTSKDQVYQFSVPFGDDEIRTVYIKLQYIGLYDDWRINEFPETIN